MPKTYSPEEIKLLRVPEDSTDIGTSSPSPKKYTPEQIKLLAVDPTEIYNDKVAQQTGPVQSAIHAVGKYAPIVGSAAGNLAFGLPGSAVGAALGSLAGQGSEAITNSISQGKPIPNGEIAGNVAGDTAINTALDGLFGLAGASGQAFRRGEGFTSDTFKSKLAKAFGGKGLDPEVGSFLHANPDFPITAPQANRSKIGEVVGNVLAPFKSQGIIETQQKKLKDAFDGTIGKFSSTTDPEALANNARQALESGKADVIDRAGKFYTNAKQIGKLNIDRAANGDVIEGAIPISDGKNFAKSILDELDKHEIPVADDQKYLINVLKRIAGVGKDTESKILDSSGKPMMIPGDNRISFDTAIKLKHLVGDAAHFQTSLPDVQEGGFRKLYKLLDADIEAGVSKWKNGSKDALDALAEGNKLTKFKYDTYGSPVNKGLMETPLSGIEQFGQINKDPVAIDKFIAGSQDATTARKSLGAKFLSDTLESTFDKATGAFNHNAPIDIFSAQENSPIIKRLFTNSERQDIQYLFKTIQAVNPNPSKLGTVALGFKGAGAAITLAPGIATLATGGDLGTAGERSAATLGVLIGANQFAKAVLLNPSVARISAGLMKAAPDTPAAKFQAKALFLALKGEQIKLTTPDGTVVGDGYVNGDGKVIPRKFSSEQN